MAATRKQCSKSTCQEEKGTCDCNGCSTTFCSHHYTEHRDILRSKLNQIYDDYNLLQDTLRDRKNNQIPAIDQRVEDSMIRIRQIAEQRRKQAIEYRNKFMVEIEKQLLNLYTVLKQNEKDSKWKPEGITVAGGNGKGDQLNQLSHPHCICIDDDQTIYVADHGNDRVVEWKCNASSSQRVAGGNGKGDQMNQFDSPSSIIIDKETNTFIIGDWKNQRVMRWSRQNNTTNGEVIISGVECWGLAMDKSGSLYISDTEKNEIRKLKRGETGVGTVVAGGNGKGHQTNQLDWPTSIFIDDNYSLYICDCYNHRVMKWVKDADEGIVVAGGNDQGESLSQLYKPQGITVDQLGRIYVADTYNQRVMCWFEGATEGTIIVGGNGTGSHSTQLRGPTDLSFDRQGNLYVVDNYNNRVQKFEINDDE